uniref:Peptidase S1 domain-containing protein n=1 Tax=Anopheles merus TaxID=30066 RepID=A0A182V8E1_ANOME
MKTFVLLVGLLAVASAEWIEIDWSQVRPIEEFDHYWERLPAEMQIYRKMLPSHRIPARLPARSDTRQFGGFTGTVSGFGRTSDGSSATSAVVRFTRNPVMTNADCIARWNTALIQPQNVCLSGEGGRSSCNGDSGGPLTVQDGGSLQIGIVSFGSAAGCSIGMPSVYARVSFFLPWIEANSNFVARP